MKFFTIATLFAAVALAVPTEELIQDNAKRCVGLDCEINTLAARDVDAEASGELAKRGGWDDDYGRGRGRFYGGRRYHGGGYRGRHRGGYRGGHRGGHRHGHRGHGHGH